MAYRSRHLQSLFNISPETVRKWANEFVDFLSPSANPPRNKTRSFTDDDLKAFATIALMRSEDDASYDDIKKMLKDGIRYEAPSVPTELLDIAASPAGVKMISLLQDLAQRVNELENVSTTQFEAENERLRKRLEELLIEIGMLREKLRRQEEPDKDNE